MKNSPKHTSPTSNPPRIGWEIHGIWNPTLPIKVFSRKWCLLGEVSDFNASMFKVTDSNDMKTSVSNKSSQNCWWNFSWNLLNLFSNILDHFNCFIIGHKGLMGLVEKGFYLISNTTQYHTSAGHRTQRYNPMPYLIYHSE